MGCDLLPSFDSFLVKLVGSCFRHFLGLNAQAQLLCSSATSLWSILDADPNRKSRAVHLFLTLRFSVIPIENLDCHSFHHTSGAAAIGRSFGMTRGLRSASIVSKFCCDIKSQGGSDLFSVLKRYCRWRDEG